jgi:hypothetical protein
MDPLTRAKLGLMLAAAIFFAGALRSGVEWPRYVAIALLAAALLLRFVGPRRGRGDTEEA